MFVSRFTRAPKREATVGGDNLKRKIADSIAQDSVAS